jgi:hypothetical protein
MFIHLTGRRRPPENLGANLAAYACLFGAGLVVLPGCGGPARIYPPKVDVAAAGRAAVAQFDTNGDQLLSPKELDKCLGIQAQFAQYDQDGDGQVSAAEIATRITALSRDGYTGMYSVMCKVTLDGAPLANAEVEFIPEEFLGGAVQSARGTTNERGMVRPAVESFASSSDTAGIKGMQPGIYRVSVTGPSDSVTARYGSGDRLGLEVSEAVLGTNIVFSLTSK